jgi:hypothetical protein
VPWTVSDVDKHKKGLTRRQKRLWVNVANSALARCEKEVGTDCEAKAIRQASAVVDSRKEKEMAESMALIHEPYPNEHAARMRDPGDFQDGSFRSKTLPNGVRMIMGRLKGETTLTVQAYRFPKSKFTAAQARKWLKDHKISCKSFEPAEDSEEEEMDKDQAQEYIDQDGTYHYIPGQVFSFDQLDAVQATEEVTREIMDLTGQYTDLVRNIIYWFEGDKVAAIRKLSDEFAVRLDDALKGMPPRESPEEEGEYLEDQAGELIEEGGDGIEKLTETFGGSIALLAEAGEAGVKDGAVRLDIAIIRPGWGNKVDNHYYPSEMLRANAGKFIGAKMYETDHRPEEKSTRTWVSTITEIVGFTDDFIERVRNLSGGGLLDKLECSIYATGKARPGFKLDGREGKEITEFLEVESVDWVTRAGAGGRALALAESDESGGITMQENENDITTNEQEAPVEKPVPIAEREQAADQPVDEQPVERPSPAPAALSAEQVSVRLDETGLPVAAKSRLLGATYPDGKALDEAIQAEIDYVKAITGSGQVFGMGRADQPVSERAETAKRVDEAAQRVNQKYFGG